MASTLSALLVEERVVTFRQMDAAVQRQRNVGGRIGTNLLELGFIDEKALVTYLSRVRGLPALDWDWLQRVPSPVLRRLTRAQVKQFGAIPFREENGRLHVGVVDPLEQDAREELAELVRMPVSEYLLPEFRFWEAVGFFYNVELPPRFRETVAQRPMRMGVADESGRSSGESPTALERSRAPGDSAVMGLTWTLGDLTEFYGSSESRDEMLEVTLGFIGKFFHRRSILIVGREAVKVMSAAGFGTLTGDPQSVLVPIGGNASLAALCGGDSYFLGPPAEAGLDGLFDGLGVLAPPECAVLPVKVGPRAAILIVGDAHQQSLEPRLLPMVFMVVAQLAAALMRLIRQKKHQAGPAASGTRPESESVRSNLRLTADIENSERRRILASIRGAPAPAGFSRGVHRIPDAKWNATDISILDGPPPPAPAAPISAPSIDLHADAPGYTEPPTFETVDRVDLSQGYDSKFDTDGKTGSVAAIQVPSKPDLFSGADAPSGLAAFVDVEPTDDVPTGFRLSAAVLAAGAAAVARAEAEVASPEMPVDDGWTGVEPPVPRAESPEGVSSPATVDESPTDLPEAQVVDGASTDLPEAQVFDDESSIGEAVLVPDGPTTPIAQSEVEERLALERSTPPLDPPRSAPPAPVAAVATPVVEMPFVQTLPEPTALRPEPTLESGPVAGPTTDHRSASSLGPAASGSGLVEFEVLAPERSSGPTQPLDSRDVEERIARSSSSPGAPPPVRSRATVPLPPSSFTGQHSASRPGFATEPAPAIEPVAADPRPAAESGESRTLGLDVRAVEAGLRASGFDDGPTQRLDPATVAHHYGPIAVAGPLPGVGSVTASSQPPNAVAAPGLPANLPGVGRVLQPSTSVPSVHGAYTSPATPAPPVMMHAPHGAGRPSYITGETDVADVADMVSRYAQAAAPGSGETTAIVVNPVVPSRARGPVEESGMFTAIASRGPTGGPVASPSRPAAPAQTRSLDAVQDGPQRNVQPDPRRYATQAMQGVGGGQTVSGIQAPSIGSGAVPGQPGRTLASADGFGGPVSTGVFAPTQGPVTTRPVDPAAAPRTAATTQRPISADQQALVSRVAQLDSVRLVAHLEHPERSVQEAVFSVLVSRGGEAHDAICAAFPGPLGRGRRANVAAGVPLEQHGPLVAVVAASLGAWLVRLRGLLDHANADARFYAAQLLSRAGDPAALAAFAPRLFDHDDQVRLTALRFVEHFRNDPSFAHIIQAIRAQLRSTDPWFAEGAIALVLHMRDLGAIPFLIEVLDHGSASTQARATQALSRMTFQDFGRQARHWERWWRKAGNEDRRSWLLDAMVDPNRVVRENAEREIKSWPGVALNYNADLDRNALKVAQRAVERHLFGR